MELRDMEYVGFWPRLGAAIIDAILVSIITLPALTLVYGSSYWTSDKFIHGPADLIISWILPAIAYVWLWVATGQTPGKMAIGARIVDADTGRNISIGKAIARYLSYFISAIGLLIGYIWIGFDPKKQGWHDHIARTVVIRSKNRGPQPVRFEG